MSDIISANQARNQIIVEARKDSQWGELLEDVNDNIEKHAYYHNRTNFYLSALKAKYAPALVNALMAYLTNKGYSVRCDHPLDLLIVSWV